MISTQDELNRHETSDNRKNKKRRIQKEYYACFLGVFLVFCSTRTIIDLQASFNIEAGVGSISTTVMNIVSVFISLTITPTLLKNCGSKVSLIISEITFLCYILSNFYPVFAVMIPAGVIAGVGESLVFPSVSLFSVYFATECAKCDSKNTESYVQRYAGRLFSLIYFSHVVGNLTAFLVMRLDNGANTNNNTTEMNETHVVGDVCGINDCQDPNVTSLYKSHYVAEQTTTYVLLGTFALLIISAILIHACFVTAIWPNKNISNSELTLPFEERKQRNTVKNIESVRIRLARTCKQIVSPNQLLLAPMFLYTGLIIMFVPAEVSRAYVSCVVGVHQGSLALALFGGVAAISSYIGGKHHRNIWLATAFAADLCSFLICLHWVPTSTKWPVFFLCGLLGYSCGIWQTQTNALVSVYFPEEQEIAFTVWNMFVCCGISLQFGWGTLLCVEQKLYANLTVLIIGTLLYGVAEYRLKCIGKERASL